MRIYTGLVVFLFSTSALASPYGLGKPAADLEVADLVPLDVVLGIAQSKAEAVWGTVSLGPPLPYCDLGGKIRAYAFGVSRGRSPFPAYEHVLAEIQEARRVGDQDLRWGIGRYGSIVVSARYSEVPIPEISDCLPRYYTTGWLAREVAQTEMASPRLTLSRIYYSSPLDILFEFSDGEERALVSPFTLKVHSSDIAGMEPRARGNPVVEEQIATLWREIEGSSLQDTVYVEGVPAFLWSYGCTPTSSAMLFGYWDPQEYGTLLDYYFDHDDCVVGFVPNVPNTQLELAIAMHTDTLVGGTQIGWIAYGHIVVANNMHGYSFSSQCSPEGGAGNDWNWSWITSEGDAGRPFHWVVINYWYGGEFIPHSLAGLGYTTDKYVIVHNTWDHGTHYWYYYTYHSGVYARTWVITLIPGGGDPNNAFLTRPVGGEHFLTGLKGLLTWNSVGAGIDHIALQHSLDNTRTWQTVTSSTSNTGSYVWNVPLATSDSARVKVEAYSSGNDLLAADGSQDRVFLFSVTDAANVFAVGYSDAAGEATDLFVDSDYVYLASGVYGLTIFDVSDSSIPIEVGRLDTPDQAYSVWVVDTLAYIADVGDGLRIVNCSDPTNPVEIQSLDTPDKAYGVYVSGSYAYVADRTSGLRVIDISDPTNPSEEGFCDTPGLAWDVWVVGDHAYVADAMNGLVVINVATPSSPFQVGSFDTPGRAYGVHVSGSLAYVADYDRGVCVIDVSDPSTPSFVDSYDTDGHAWNVWVDNGYVYVADGEDGMRVLAPDLSEVGHYNTHSEARGVFFHEPLVWVADGGDGTYALIAPPYGVEEVREAGGRRQEARLHQNYPNPFSRTTTITYLVAGSRSQVAGNRQLQADNWQRINLSVYDLAGRLVRNLVDGERAAGTYAAIWDGTDWQGKPVPTGVYFYELTCTDFALTRKLLLLR